MLYGATFRLDWQWLPIYAQKVNMDNQLLLCQQQSTCHTYIMPPSPQLLRRATLASGRNWEQLLTSGPRLSDTQQILLMACQGKSQTDWDLDSRAVAKTSVCTWTKACQLPLHGKKTEPSLTNPKNWIHHIQNSNVLHKEVNPFLKLYKMTIVFIIVSAVVTSNHKKCPPEFAVCIQSNFPKFGVGISGF